MDRRDLISTREAAAILHVSRQRVQQLVAEGKLEASATRSPDRRSLFRRVDVERLRVERGVGLGAFRSLSRRAVNQAELLPEARVPSEADRNPVAMGER